MPNKTPMSRFNIPDALTAPEASLPILKGLQSSAGQLPNFLGVLAGSAYGKASPVQLFSPLDGPTHASIVGYGRAGNEDRFADPQFPQMDRLLHKGNPDVIDIGLDERHNTIYAMTISIRLNHWHDPGRCHLPANCLQVVF